MKAESGESVGRRGNRIGRRFPFLIFWEGKGGLFGKKQLALKDLRGFPRGAERKCGK